MTQPQRAWILGWEAAADRLAELRRRDLAHVDVSRAIEALNDAFESARAHAAPSRTSGLVAQQAWFMRLPR